MKNCLLILLLIVTIFNYSTTQTFRVGAAQENINPDGDSLFFAEIGRAHV